MNKKILGGFFALMLSLNATSLRATEEAISSEETTTENQSLGDQDKVAHIHWDFITCVCTDHECQDEADYHGYDHYRTQHDHFRCSGHEHLACYGGHHQ